MKLVRRDERHFDDCPSDFIDRNPGCNGFYVGKDAHGQSRFDNGGHPVRANKHTPDKVNLGKRFNLGRTRAPVPDTVALRPC
jgi:hypothetical protein